MNNNAFSKTMKNGRIHKNMKLGVNQEKCLNYEEEEEEDHWHDEKQTGENHDRVCNLMYAC